MKECPNCRKKYAADLFFCLDDGAPLRSHNADPDAATEAAFDVRSLRTEILPIQPTTQVADSIPTISASRPRSSKLPYVAIGVLALLCLTLGGVIVGMNMDRWLTKKTASNESPSATATPVAVLPSTTNISAPASTPTLANQTVKPATLYVADGRWIGEWSTASGTLFDFELRLDDKGGSALEGQIKWTMRRTARPDKRDKIGLSATEYVRGSYDPTTGDVGLTGFRKDDPDDVLVMVDTYRLKISADGKALTGQARNGGKWNGRVNLRR